MSDTPEVSLEALPARPRRSRGRVVVGIVAAVAVVAGAAFAAVSLSDSGSNAPEDPVRAMFAAAEKGDILGVMAELDPGERDALKGPLTDVVQELNRLDVLKDADLGHLTGVDLEVDDLELASEKVDDGLAHVRITNGKGNFHVDASKLPLGGFVRDLVGDGLKDARSSSSESLKSTDTSEFVTTVRRGDRWYVSIGYSLAEIARLDAGKTRAELGRGIPAAGTSTPEAAVRDMIMAATALDLRRVIELLPPDELGALQDYADLFIGDVEQGVEGAKDQFSIEIPTLQLDSSTSGDHATVKIRTIAFSATFGAVSLSYKDGCIDVAPPGGEPQHICDLKNPGALLGTFGFPSDLQPPKLSFSDKKPNAGIEATKVDGNWYVSPTRSSLVSLVKLLELFQRSDLTTLRDYYRKAMLSFSQSMESSLSESGSLTLDESSEAPAPATVTTSGY